MGPIYRYVENGSLANTMKKFGSFPESLVAIYITQVAAKGMEPLCTALALNPNPQPLNPKP